MPFSEGEFFGVFAAYNEAVRPAQVVLTVLAVAVVLLAALGGRSRSRLAAAGLGVLWIWTGLVYHVGFFAAVNPAAYLFGALFVAQGLLLLTAALKRSIAFEFSTRRITSWLGVAFALYAIAIYPLLGRWLGHTYPATPTFGAPCPVTIVTIAVLTWALPPAPLRLLAVPIAWSLIGGSAVLAFGMWEDLMLVLAGITLAAVAVLNRVVPPGETDRRERGAQRRRKAPDLSGGRSPDHGEREVVSTDGHGGR